MARLIVTGCARSGTQYMRNVLSQLGLRASHEKIYNHDLNPVDYSFDVVEQRWHMIDAECSWMAVPFLSDKYQDDLTVFHQLRDPLKILRCFRHTEVLNSHNGAALFVHRLLPECGEGSALQRAVHYILGWWRMMDRVSAFRYRVETMTANRLHSMLKASGIGNIPLEKVYIVLADVNKNIGTCGHESHKYDLTWDEIRTLDGGDELKRRAAHFGYV